MPVVKSLRRTYRSGLWAGLLAFGVTLPLAAEVPPDGDWSPRAGPPRFADPDRQAKLRRAIPEIDHIFRSFLESDGVPGAAWGIVIDGELVHTASHGVRDLASGDPANADTVFRIASMTKSFVALAILKLRDEGWLALDDPAERHVPELARLEYPTTDSPRITVRDLLTHSAGFPEDNPWADQQLAISEEELDALIQAGIPFSRAPGTAYEYSNFGYALLGRIVTNLTGQPFSRYVEDEILQPLGLHATTMDPQAVPPERLASGYRLEDGQWKAEPPLGDGAFGPIGGMLTSIHDLGRYVAHILAAFPARDGPETGPVRRASLREMQQTWRVRLTAVSRAEGESVKFQAGGYGYGLRAVQTEAFSHISGHSGGLPGSGSLMLWLPEHGVGLVAAGNLTYTRWGPSFDAAFAALAATGGLQPRTPVPSPALLSAQAAVAGLIREWDDERARSIAADNLFKDRSLDHRRRDFAEIRNRHGSCECSPNEPLQVENALRGDWVMRCERGGIRVHITLSPTVPPRIQHLHLESLPD